MINLRCQVEEVLTTLGYGVMVAQQILVLFVRVRISVSQLTFNKAIMEEAKKILYRLHKMESITDEELDILLQAINKGDGMFHYTETTTTYPEGCPCPYRPIGDNIMYGDPFDDKFGKVK